jgi:2,4-dienoyl-CoA reductase-like NADH-dependent reductase (Old Yellow Enzyme family)
VSRNFKYKTAEALEGDARARGLDVRLQSDLSPLTAPISVGGRRLGNRLAIHPMEGCDGTPDGAPGELTVRRYERFGAGGAKLIWGEAAAVVPEARANTRQLLADRAHAAGLAQLVQVTRAAHRASWGEDSDLLVGLQLTHSGRYSVPRPILAQHDPLLDPRTVVDKSRGTKAGPDTPLISDDDLDRLLDSYSAAASVAFEAGFDFVDVKQCHRYLLNELLAAKTRPGKYGGPFEHRTRFIRELVARLRAENPSGLIATRLGVFDGLPFHPTGPDAPGAPDRFTTPVSSVWGTNEDDPFTPDLAEPLAIVGALRDLGIALVNVSMGNPYASPHIVRPFEYAPIDGYLSPEHPLISVARHFRLTAAIQAAYPDLAVVGSGYSWLQAFAFQAGAANVSAGKVSIMGIGRGSLSQPDFGRHVLLGAPLDPKRTCRTFSYCTALMRSKHHPLGQFATGCPPFDKSVYGPIWDEARETAPKQA